VWTERIHALGGSTPFGRRFRLVGVDHSLGLFLSEFSSARAAGR
jgi:hypothetical protein